jgi:hypothetical protein
MIGKILSFMCLGFVTSEFSSDIYPHLFYNQDFQVYSKESCIAAAIISHYATCLADTLAVRKLQSNRSSFVSCLRLLTF